MHLLLNFEIETKRTQVEEVNKFLDLLKRRAKVVKMIIFRL